MGLTDDLRALAWHDAGAAEREVQMAEREPRDVRETSVIRLDEPPALALDGIRAGFVEGLTGAHIAFDLTKGQLAKPDARPDGELSSSAARGRTASRASQPHVRRPLVFPCARRRERPQCPPRSSLPRIARPPSPWRGPVTRTAVRRRSGCSTRTGPGGGGGAGFAVVTPTQAAASTQGRRQAAHTVLYLGIHAVSKRKA